MSRIGLGDGLIQNNQCLRCKRYKKASKTPKVFSEAKTYGRCTLGYCERNRYGSK